YFLDRVAERLIIFTGTGRTKRFIGTYSEYLETISGTVTKERTKSEKNPPVVKEKKRKKKLTYQEQKEWDTIEDDIMALEEQVEALEQEIGNAGSDSEKVQKLFGELEEVKQNLDRKLERW